MMKLKSLAVFAGAVAVFMTGATYRFHDSAHAIGRLSLGGGEVSHPVLLDQGRSLYTIIVTGKVAGPYHGDAQVTLEGDRAMKYRIYNSGPVIDLGFFRRPRFRENTFYDLRERDKVALWVDMRPGDNAGASDRNSGPAAFGVAGSDCCDIEEGPPPERSTQGATSAGSPKRLSLAFRDARTGKPLLNVPIIFKGKEESNHGRKR